MTHVKFVEPEASENFVRNPRMMGAVADYVAVGTTRSYTFDEARWGPRSLKVVTDNVNLNEGVYIQETPDAVAGQIPYAFSVYAKGAGRVRLHVFDTTNTKHWYSKPVDLRSDRWTRLEVIGTQGSGAATFRLYVETAETVQNVTFYVDGFQFEQKAFCTTYFDGDLELETPSHDGDAYYRWLGGRNDSPSSRSAQCRIGGKWTKIENMNTNLFVTESSGLGTPPILMDVQKLGMDGRSKVNAYTVDPRVIMLTFTAKKVVPSKQCYPGSLKELNRAREKLIRIVKPDRTIGVQPLRMAYDDGTGRCVECYLYYESGLEWQGDLRDDHFNQFAVRFMGVDPFWYYDDVQSEEVTPEKTLTANYIMRRVEGEWQPLDTTGVDGEVYVIAVHPDGTIYVGGAFGTAGGDVNCDYVARYDPETDNFSPLVGAAELNGNVLAIAFSHSGKKVYIGGEFTQQGGANCGYIIEYDHETDAYSTMGVDPGLNNEVRAICVDEEGLVYVGGQFTQTRLGVETYYYICKYNPDRNEFEEIGSGDGGDPGFNNIVNCLAMHANGKDVFVGGVFTDRHGGGASAHMKIAKYDAEEDVMTPLGTGMNDHVNDILVAPDGALYVVGEFDHAGYADVGHVAKWNGQEWYPLGVENNGCWGGWQDGEMRAIGMSYKGLITLGGDCMYATGYERSRNLVSWNGTRFQRWDMEIPFPAGSDWRRVYAVAHHWDDMYLAFRHAGTARGAYVFEVDNNGKATAFPVFFVNGPGRILWIENQTTAEVMRCDINVEPNEHLVIDFRPWRRMIWSSSRGYFTHGIMPDSDRLTLLPGTNQLAFWMLGSLAGSVTESEVAVRWENVAWSFDDARYA